MAELHPKPHNLNVSNRIPSRSFLAAPPQGQEAQHFNFASRVWENSTGDMSPSPVCPSRFFSGAVRQLLPRFLLQVRPCQVHVRSAKAGKATMNAETASSTILDSGAILRPALKNDLGVIGPEPASYDSLIVSLPCKVASKTRECHNKGNLRTHKQNGPCDENGKSVAKTGPGRARAHVRGQKVLLWAVVLGSLTKQPYLALRRR